MSEIFTQGYWPLLFSLVLPPVVAFIARTSWSGRAKSWTALVLSAGIGIAAAVTSGVPITVENMVVLIAIARAGAQVAYDVFRSVGVTSDLLDVLLEAGSCETD